MTWDAADYIATTMPGATDRDFVTAGHGSNTDRPAEFDRVVTELVDCVGP